MESFLYQKVSDHSCLNGGCVPRADFLFYSRKAAKSAKRKENNSTAFFVFLRVLGGFA